MLYRFQKRKLKIFYPNLSFYPPKTENILYFKKKVTSIVSKILRKIHVIFENIAKGTTDPRVEFKSQDHRSQILITFHLQNID